MDVVDVMVVGGGPAGLAAASWVARYRRSVLVVDSGEHRADAVETSHGYLWRDPQRPRELLEAGRAELLAYPTARIAADCVVQVERRDAAPGEPGFLAVLSGGSRLLAHRVVLACGVRDILPPVTGAAEHYGASLFHCPACDGYEARGARVVVLGWSAHLTDFAAQLLGWAESVTVVTAGRPLVPEDGEGDVRGRARQTLDYLGVEVVEDVVEALIGERGDLRGVRLRGGRELACSIAFFSVSHRPRTELAAALGCRIDGEGYVEVNSCNETSVDGVYAAGDLTPGLQLTAVAAAKGVVAGVACAQSFGDPRTGRRTPAPEPRDSVLSRPDSSPD